MTNCLIKLFILLIICVSLVKSKKSLACQIKCFLQGFDYHECTYTHNSKISLYCFSRETCVCHAKDPNDKNGKQSTTTEEVLPEEVETEDPDYVTSEEPPLEVTVPVLPTDFSTPEEDFPEKTTRSTITTKPTTRPTRPTRPTTRSTTRPTRPTTRPTEPVETTIFVKPTRTTAIPTKTTKPNEPTETTEFTKPSRTKPTTTDGDETLGSTRIILDTIIINNTRPTPPYPSQSWPDVLTTTEPTTRTVSQTSTTSKSTSPMSSEKTTKETSPVSMESIPPEDYTDPTEPDYQTTNDFTDYNAMRNGL